MKKHIQLQESLKLEQLEKIREQISEEYNIPMEEIPSLDILEDLEIDNLTFSIAPKGFDNPIVKEARIELYELQEQLYEWEATMEEIDFVRAYEGGYLSFRISNDDNYEYYKDSIEEFLYKNGLTQEEFFNKYEMVIEELEERIEVLKQEEKTYIDDLRIYSIIAKIDDIEFDTTRGIIRFERDEDKMKINLIEEGIKSLEYDRRKSNGDLIMCGSQVIEISDDPKQALKQVLEAINLTDEKVIEKMPSTLDILKDDLFKNNFRESLEELQIDEIEI